MYKYIYIIFFDDSSCTIGQYHSTFVLSKQQLFTPLVGKDDPGEGSKMDSVAILV